MTVEWLEVYLTGDVQLEFDDVQLEFDFVQLEFPDFKIDIPYVPVFPDFEI